jgi:hypothetical protein
MNKVFHIRTKVISHTTFFLKGICIAKTKKRAIFKTLFEVDKFLKNSPRGDKRDVSIVEIKELRADFILHHKDNDSN